MVRNTNYNGMGDIMSYKITSRSVQDTVELAQNIESEKFPNMVICLQGDLGSGKTIFTKGFASSLGIDEAVTSPTFNIIKEYNSGEMDLYHMDVYRLDGKVDDLGIEEYFSKNGIVILNPGIFSIPAKLKEITGTLANPASFKAFLIKPI